METTVSTEPSAKKYKFTDYFTAKEKEGWQVISNYHKPMFIPEMKRLLCAGFLKRHFKSFVHVLGYRDLGAFHEAEIERLSKVRRLDDQSTRRLWLWSRGFFKTSLITEAHTLWLIVNNPDIRILLVSNTISVAEDILRNIKGHLISNYEFRYFFREFCPTPNKEGKVEFGTCQEFTIPNRTKATKEPTLMAAGIGTNLTGLHYDYIKVDDLVTQASVTNDSQIQASKDYYASLRQLFDKAAVPREDVVGTIYHFNDLYSLLRKTGLFSESYIPARLHGKPTFPERLSDLALDELVSDLSVGPYQFQTQYMLNPINPADAKFQEHWLDYYDENVEANLAQYILCDPASTQKKKSDYTVIERWGISDKGTHYLLEGIRDKLKAFERIDRLFEMVKNAKNLKWVSYEVIGGRHGDLEIIRQRQQEQQLFFYVKETKSSSQSKADRIEQRLVPLYHARCVKLPRQLWFKSLYDGKTYNFTELLKLEYLQFPFTEHDDILDCQAQIMEEQLIRGEKPALPIKREGTTADEWEKLYSFLDKNKKRYPDPVMRSNRMFMQRMKGIVRNASR